MIDEQHYYPYGLLLSKSSATGVQVNRYAYQGNELQPELGIQHYDFHARQYDPQIGRFWGVDPLSDYSQEQLSPYHFCAGDPANFVDPGGLDFGTPVMGPEVVFTDTREKVYKNDNGTADLETSWQIDRMILQMSQGVECRG